MKITNYKLQITNKFQISNSKFQKFGILKIGAWSLFVIWLLVLVISFALSGSAKAWVIGEPIVPCGGTGGGFCDFNAGSGGGAGECFGGPNAGNPCTSNAQCISPQPPCTQCELLHLVDNLIDFILIAAAPILATFFFILAGVYIMLGGAKPDMLATGKRMFSSALIGIIIVMLAWLMTNTLITSLVKGTLVLGNMPFNSADWWQLTCSSVGLKETPPGT